MRFVDVGYLRTKLESIRKKLSETSAINLTCRLGLFCPYMVNDVLVFEPVTDMLLERMLVHCATAVDKHGLFGTLPAHTRVALRRQFDTSPLEQCFLPRAMFDLMCEPYVPATAVRTELYAEI